MMPRPTPSPWLSLSLSVGIAAMLGVGGRWLISLSDTAHPSRVEKLPAVAPSKGTSTPKAGARAGLQQVAPGEFGQPPASSLVATSPTDDGLTKLIRDTLDKPGAVASEALLTFADKAALARFLKRAKAYGLEVIGTIDGLNTARVRYARQSSLHNLFSDPTADKPSLEPNQWMTVPRLPKEDSANQGGAIAYGDAMLRAIGATGDRSKWGETITVAVLDTGIETHPAFGKDQVTHIDLVGDGSPMHGHGTSVASLIAGEDDRVPGVAPATHLLDIRVANEKGLSVSSVLAQGILEAIKNGAQVINISMGSYSDSPTLRAAVAQAAQRNVIIVAAAGNEKFDMLAYPAAIPWVISVASVDKDGRQAYFSNSGNGLDIAAPGVGLTTAWGHNMAAQVSGTSQSTGIVSGAIAAMLSRGVKPNDILRQLQVNARATGAPPNQVGSGILNMSWLWQ